MAVIRLDGSRRSFLRRIGALGAAHTIGAVGLAQRAFAQQAKPKAGTAAKSAAGKPWSNGYWAKKGDVKLYMFRKRRHAPTPGEPPPPVLFLVHGSSISGRSTFDLTRPGQGEYSVMNVFVRLRLRRLDDGLRSYGRSSRTGKGNSDITSGVADLEMRGGGGPCARRVQRRCTCSVSRPVALRAGAYAMAHPDRVDRLVLARVHLQGGEIADAHRTRQAARVLPHAQPAAARPRDDPQHLHTRQGRDHRPAIADILADVELQFGEHRANRHLSGHDGQPCRWSIPTRCRRR